MQEIYGSIILQFVEFWNTKLCSGYGKGREREVLSPFVIPIDALFFFFKEKKAPKILKKRKLRKLVTEGLFDTRVKKQFFYATSLNLFYFSLKRAICFPFHRAKCSCHGNCISMNFSTENLILFTIWVALCLNRLSQNIPPPEITPSV